MNTKTIIICLIYTISNNTIKMVSSNEDSMMLPQIDISTLNSKKHHIELNNIVKVIFEKSVRLNFTWTKPKLINIELINEEENNTVTTTIYYGIYVPDNTLLINSFWIDIQPYIGHYETLRKLVCML